MQLVNAICVCCAGGQSKVQTAFSCLYYAATRKCHRVWRACPDSPHSLYISQAPPSLLSYLPLKAAEIFFCVCKNFAFCCFHCFLGIFFFCAYLPELSVLLYPTPPFPSPYIRPLVTFLLCLFVCLSYDMRHMKYGGYDIRNMSSLNFPQCYCYSSQPPDTFPFRFPVPFLSHNFSFISLISLPTLFALYSDFRLCKWIL